jgi:hypothetical protein
MKNKLIPGTIVEIYWWDIESSTKWSSKDEIDKLFPPSCRTVGYYYGCRKEKGRVKWIIINHSKHDATQEADYTLIPWGCVQRMEKIE